jgi:TRAP-type C4-dicarboxylate transport system permease small subunit
MIERARYHDLGSPGWVRAKPHVDFGLAWVVVVLMSASVVNVLWQVTTRFVLGDPSGFTDELSRYLLIWIGLLGGAYAVGKRLHLAIDLLPERLTGNASAWLAILIKTLIIVFAVGVMIVGGSRLVYIVSVLGQTSAALRVPLGYVYLSLPLSGVLMVYYCAAFIYEEVARLRGLAPSPESGTLSGARALGQQLVEHHEVSSQRQDT